MAARKPTAVPSDDASKDAEEYKAWVRATDRKAEAEAWLAKGSSPAEQYQKELDGLQVDGWKIAKVDTIHRELGPDDVYDVAYTVTVTLERQAKGGR